MLIDERREFGALLRWLRKRAQLSLRDLASTSGVAFPNISAIERGRLAAGRIVATKLAVALGLKSREKKQFLAFASFTNSRDRLAREFAAYPAILASLVPRMIRDKEIKPQDIIKTWWVDEQFIEHPSNDDPDLLSRILLKPKLSARIQQGRSLSGRVVLFLKDGRQILIECTQQSF
jgi:transcriptional regulator with XRE-family HTH domain